MRSFNIFFFLVFVAVVGQSEVRAGSDTTDCKLDDSVEFSVGNGSNTVKFLKATNVAGNRDPFEVPIQLKPYYDYNTELNASTISALPVDDPVIISDICTEQRFTRANGEVCYGRQFPDLTYSQTLLLTFADGTPLLTYRVPEGRNVPGLNSSGYLVGRFLCHQYGATTSGGCRVENDDDIVDVVPCANR